MRISQIPDMPDRFEIIFFGDDQEGNTAKAHDKLKQCVEYILADPNRYAVHMGDACDAFWADDKRYDPTTTTATPIKQMAAEVVQLAPLVRAGRLLTVLQGNHELALNAKVGDFSELLCDELRREGSGPYPIYGTYTHKLEFLGTDKRSMFKVYLTHGRRSITSISPDAHRRKAYMQFRLKRLLENKAGDCIAMVRGHSHIVLVTPPVPTLYLSDVKGKLKQAYTTPGAGSSSAYIPPEHRFYGCSGSFLRSQVEGVSTYSEIGEYDPVELGYLIGTVQDRQFVDLREVKV